MNNEEKILEILAQMQGDIAGLKDGQARLETKQDKMQGDIAGLKDGQARLETKQDKMQEDISEIKSDIKYLWEDVERISDRLHVQEKIVEKKIM